MQKLTAVDLFAGAGGITLGLHDAEFETLFANDMDPAAAATYTENLPGVHFDPSDIRDLSSRTVLRKTRLRRGELDLLIGGPPCQGFSIIGSRVVEDPRNNLFREFFKIAKGLQPKAIVIENVPGLVTLARGAILDSILKAFDDAKYQVSFAELLAAQYGVPQMRWRMVFVGFRKDLQIPGNHGFPAPTHGSVGIGHLIPNCTIMEAQIRGFLRAADAFSDLPAVEPGEEESVYSGKPKRPYQQMMRKGMGRELHNHYAPRLSEANLRRIAALRPGQDWRDLPNSLLPEGMKRAKRKDHTRRYRRMSWDGVPRSIITRFRDPKSGEYTHPDQNRTISIREAARIQSFPDNFIFLGNHSDQYNLVGNAVPPLLAAAIAREVALCLSGESTHVLKDPFSRRPSWKQQRLAF